MSTIVSVALMLISSLASDFDCNGKYACYNKTLICEDNQNCNINCNGESSCGNTIMSCPNSSDTNTRYQCNVWCNGSFACMGILNNGLNSDIFINGSGDENYQGFYVNASLAYNLTMISDGFSAFHVAQIICPARNVGTYPICNIIYNGNANGNGFNSLYISSNASFDGINLICSHYGSGDNVCYEDTGPQYPFLYCSEPNDPFPNQVMYQCEIITNDGKNWECENGQSYVKCMTPSPTNSPTTAPTVPTKSPTPSPVLIYTKYPSQSPVMSSTNNGNVNGFDILENNEIVVISSGSLIIVMIVLCLYCICCRCRRRNRVDLNNREGVPNIGSINAVSSTHNSSLTQMLNR